MLLDPRKRRELLEIVAELSALSQLSNEERRARAIRGIAAWLRARGIVLSEHELNLLVESLVHGAKGR